MAAYSWADDVQYMDIARQFVARFHSESIKYLLSYAYTAVADAVKCHSARPTQQPPPPPPKKVHYPGDQNTSSRFSWGVQIAERTTSRLTITTNHSQAAGGPLSQARLGVSDRDSYRRASNDGTTPDVSGKPDFIFPPAPLLGLMTGWHTYKVLMA